MTRMTPFSSPLLLGFDAMEKTIERIAKSGDGYPPYNIERLHGAEISNVRLRITLAVAGFSESELDVSTEENQLIIRGRQQDDENRDFLHRGIAARQFQRAFMLADGMKVLSAELKNGLLWPEPLLQLNPSFEPGGYIDELIDAGQLTGWILDLRSARQLGLKPTGQGSRGLSSPPGPGSSNVHLQPGTSSPQVLFSDIKHGLFVTELIGSSINMVTGDYSRGASGYWIENGELTFPVSEITIAGNLREMFRSLQPADDLEFRAAVNAPTCRVEGLTIAGI